MADITGLIRSKKLGDTGFPEELMKRDHKKVGHTHVVIAEVQAVQQHGPDVEGDRKVDYIITDVQVVPEDLEERLRDVKRVIYLNRPEQQGQTVLTGTADGDGRTPADAVATLEAGLPAAADEDACPVEGCTLPAFHDGDHIPDPDAHPDV